MTNSSGYWRYWGKAGKELPEDGASCHLLVYHSLDVAAVGYEYLVRSDTFKRLLSSYLPVDDETIFLDWLAFWLSLHDLGKFALAFQAQRRDLVQSLRGRECESRKIYDKRHDTLGWLFWKDSLKKKIASERWFGEASDFLDELLGAWAQAVMGHHGQPPDSDGAWGNYFHGDDALAAWRFAQEMRTLFLSRKEVAGLPCMPDIDAFSKQSPQLSWWIAGLT
ncbi:MAG: CRISPR-associated endonuclease Cas3'', partial [Azoarcus sp.]|nr:CRISPR-associated endonuclease Cas3'' [Azoarcus sp.]